MHQRHFLFAASFALFLCVLASGCGPSAQEKAAAKQKLVKAHKDAQDGYAKFVADEKALMPVWFRARYPQWQDGPDVQVPENTDSLGASWYGAPVGSYINPLLLTISLVGLLFYPLWLFLGCLWYSRATGDNELFDGFTEDPPQAGAFFLIGTTACYAANIILSWVFFGLIYLGLSLFNQVDYYVPWAFISYSLHAVVHLTALAVLASLGFRAIFRSFGASTTPAISGTPPNPSNAGGHSPNPTGGRIRAAVLAVVKSLIVAILTGVGSELGGLIGGALVFVSAAGVAAFFGFTMPSSTHR